MPELRHITRIAAAEQMITAIRGIVKVHLHNIYTKLGINKRTALVAIALAHREELMSPPRRMGSPRALSPSHHKESITGRWKSGWWMPAKRPRWENRPVLFCA
jgi:hypothetical protein